jgi:heat shock protein HtpX
MKRIFLFIATNLAVVALLSIIGGIASVIVSWYSRRREFRADRGGANLAGSGSMIAALQSQEMR